MQQKARLALPSQHPVGYPCSYSWYYLPSSQFRCVLGRGASILHSLAGRYCSRYHPCGFHCGSHIPSRHHGLKPSAAKEALRLKLPTPPSQCWRHDGLNRSGDSNEQGLNSLSNLILEWVGMRLPSSCCELHGAFSWNLLSGGGCAKLFFLKTALPPPFRKPSAHFRAHCKSTNKLSLVFGQRFRLKALSHLFRHPHAM